MPYLVTVTNQVKNIGITESPAYTVQVQDPTTARFDITETANTVTIFDTVNSTSIYLNAIELRLNDLNSFWRSEWVPDTADYLHGDLVTYQNSLFLLSVYNEDGAAFYPVSDVPPPDDANWIRIVWHEAPFQYIINNGTLEVFGTSTFQDTVFTNAGLVANGPVTVNGTSTFNALATFNSTATFNDNINAQSNLTVYGDFSVGASSEGYKLLINGDSKFNGSVYVENTATFNGDVNFINNNTINGNPSFADNVTFNSLTVTNILTLADGAVLNGQIPGIFHRGERDGIFYLVDYETNEEITSLAYAQQGERSLAIGWGKKSGDYPTQGQDSVAIGYRAGGTSANGFPGTFNVAIGNFAGLDQTFGGVVSLGHLSGNNNLGDGAIAIGYKAGIRQKQGAIAIGYEAASAFSSLTLSTQGDGAIAIGREAGWIGQGPNSIAIGEYAGKLYQSTGSIIISAIGTATNATNQGLYITPIRAASTGSYSLYYDPVTYEITQAPVSVFNPDQGVL